IVFACRLCSSQSIGVRLHHTYQRLLMRTALVASIFLLGSSLTAQNVLHYKFDGGCGSEVINFASGAGNALLSTTLAGGPDAARVVGMFGQALTGSNSTVGNTRVDTGWAPFTASGDFSF